jgi:thiamine biosynthesis lipoprotein ApbE
MDMNRRSFLKLPALFPFTGLDFTLSSREHHFQYERIVGTSLDLTVWTPDSDVAECVCTSVLREINRLTSILDTRDAASEITLFGHSNGRQPSRELKEVFDAYDYWERLTGGIFSIRPGGSNMPWSVDALGKAYIIDQAAGVARKAWPSIDALLLNIGGDIVVWGRSCRIGIADARYCYDNARPLTTIEIQNAAVATSGTYARGAHLIDPRSGLPITTGAAATVVARDAVTANALATTLCLVKPDSGLQLVESTPGAEALRAESGVVERTSGFARLERPLPVQTPVSTSWPPGYQVTVTLPLKSGRSSKRPYVAVWVEDASGQLVRSLALWGNKSKYFPDLSTAWNLTRGNQKLFHSVTRATRPPGRYDLVWDGKDNDNKPVPLGTYRITVETNQERGTYAKQTGTIMIGENPTSITLPATANFDEVLVTYGPKQP